MPLERNCDICSKTLKLKKLSNSHRFEDVMILFIPDMEKENERVLKVSCMKCYKKINKHVGKIQKFEPKYDMDGECIDCKKKISFQQCLNNTPFCWRHIDCRLCKKDRLLNPEDYEKDPRGFKEIKKNKLCQNCFKQVRSNPNCRCDLKCKSIVVVKSVKNRGKYYFTCISKQCKFFAWDKERNKEHTRRHPTRRKKRKKRRNGKRQS